MERFYENVKNVQFIVKTLILGAIYVSINLQHSFHSVNLRLLFTSYGTRDQKTNSNNNIIKTQTHENPVFKMTKLLFVIHDNIIILVILAIL